MPIYEPIAFILSKETGWNRRFGYFIIRVQEWSKIQQSSFHNYCCNVKILNDNNYSFCFKMICKMENFKLHLESSIKNCDIKQRQSGAPCASPYVATTCRWLNLLTFGVSFMLVLVTRTHFNGILSLGVFEIQNINAKPPIPCYMKNILKC